MDGVKSVLGSSHQPIATHYPFPCAFVSLSKSPVEPRIRQSLNPTLNSDQPTSDKLGSAPQLTATTNTFVMLRHGSNTLHHRESHPNRRAFQESMRPSLVWDWDIEHEDRKRERKVDATLRGAAPFEVDRRVLKDVVHEKMGSEVGRIKFLSAGMSRPEF